MRSKAWQESAVQAGTWDHDANKSSPATRKHFVIHVVFVAVLSSPSSHPKQYLGMLPSDVDLGEEFGSSTMLKLGLSDRHLILFIQFHLKSLKKRPFPPTVLSYDKCWFGGKWHDQQPHRCDLQQKLPNLRYTHMREILWARITQ